MTEQESSEFSEAEVIKNELRPEGPGTRLRLTRQAKNISIDDMAKQLRFTVPRLEQLEADEYKNMGSAAFAKGYLRSYAKHLGIGEEEIKELLNLFTALNLESSIHSNTPQLINERIVHTNPRATRRFGYFVVIVLIGMISFWWHKHSNNLHKVHEKSAAANHSGSNEAVIMPVNQAIPVQQSSEVAPNNPSTTTSPTSSLPISTPFALDAEYDSLVSSNGDSETVSNTSKRNKVKHGA